jgi:hypothetical protein
MTYLGVFNFGTSYLGAKIGQNKTMTKIYRFTVLIALLVAISVMLVRIHTDTDKPICGNTDTSKYGHVDQEGSATSKYGHVDLEEFTTPSVFRDLTSEKINGLMIFLHSRKELIW